VVLIVDETADEKSSADCVGAACQYRGTVGGTALCQVAVTLTYAAQGGHALIGRALYLPEGWAADDERRELAGVPDDVTFETKPQLPGPDTRTRMSPWPRSPGRWESAAAPSTGHSSRRPDLARP
jgi:SRSO17 transposase